MRNRLILAFVLAVVSSTALANGLNSDNSFAFMDPNAKAVEQNGSSLKLLHDGGYYDGFSTTNNVTVTCTSGSVGCGASSGAIGSSSTQIGSYLNTTATNGGIATVNAQQTNSGTQLGSSGGGVTVNNTPSGVPVGSSLSGTITSNVSGSLSDTLGGKK